MRSRGGRAIGLFGSTVLLATLITSVTTAPAGARGLRPGSFVRVGRMSGVVPALGRGVEAYADFKDGSSEFLSITTGPDGTVTVDSGSSPAARVSSASAPAVASDCNDDYNDYAGPRWIDTMTWYFQDSGTPSYLNVDNVETDLRAAVTNITHENNTCGRPDTITATASYQGRVGWDEQIGSGGGCAVSGDGHSVVGFGPLDTLLGKVCNWTAYTRQYGYIRVESDIRLDNNSKWTTGSCSGQFANAYFVEGVTTHERGHTWNATDYPAGHPTLTMGQANGNCGTGSGTDEKQTLGLGDMLSFEHSY
jgi:hypothetical protein